MRNAILITVSAALLFFVGFSIAGRSPSVVHAQAPRQGGIPKSYGHLVSAVSDSAGTVMVFEDARGTIRFVTLTGEMQGELTRN